MTDATRPPLPATTLGLLVAAGLAGVVWVGVSASDAAAWALAPALVALTLAAAAAVPWSPRAGLLALGALGLGCAAYLFGQKACWWGASACTIGEVFDCGKVNASPQSMVAGLPIALLGAGFYAGVVAAAWSARTSRDLGLAGQLTALLALPSVAYSAYLGWVSEQLGAFCIVCITMYAVNALLLWAGLRAAAAGGRGLAGDLGSLPAASPTSSLLATGALVLLVGWRTYDPACAEAPVTVTKRADGSADFSSLYSAPRGAVRLSGDEPVLGNPGAPVVVLEFADFGCPHCARASKEVHELVQVRSDVQVRFRPFPLTGLCNPGLPDNGAGQERCDAAVAAECARRQGRFWEMSEQLFTNQGYFAAEQLRFMAEEIGLDVGSWASCLSDPAALEAVKASGQAGGELQLMGTPSFFAKGLAGDGWVEVGGGVPAVLALLEAREDGVVLPAPKP